MSKVSDIFDVVYGVNLDLIDCTPLPKEKGGIPFVARSSKNNGVVEFVEAVDGVNANPAHSISVAAGGSVLSSFYHEQPYYSGRDLFYLKPRVQLTRNQMLFYCLVLRRNAYKYNFGRQANRSLKNIIIPDVRDIPEDFLSIKVELPRADSYDKKKLLLTQRNWKLFKYGGKEGIFKIKNGYYNRKPDHTEHGTIPFIGATEFNNGVTEYYSLFDIENNDKDENSIEHSLEKKIFAGNCITVANNGASVASAFYQEKEFTCSHDVNILYIKDYECNKYIALFLCTLIRLEKYRWAYGRKWRPIRMPKSEIKLPVDSKNKPDWQFMENYIKGLPFSGEI